MSNKTIAFIPVRGGSKSIPYKNIKNICGKPLVIWTIEAALFASDIDEVVISTDSDLIEQTIEGYFNLNKNDKLTKLKIYRRNAENATDEATTESAMLEYAHNNQFTTIVLIQATSPLLATEDINLAVSKYNNYNFDSILSVVRQKRFIWNHIDNTNTVKPYNYQINKRPRRQEYDGFLVENGALYITSRELLLNTGQRISGNIGYIEMSEETYFELDEQSDWIIVEELLKFRHGISGNTNIDNINIDNVDISSKAKKIKLFAMDCDGVLTDAGMYYSATGDELKKFNTKDGMGIRLLHEAGITTAIITGEDTQIVKNRAAKLKIKEVHQGISDKVAVMQKICEQYGYNLDEVAYIGDDINDAELLKKVGLSFTVADGHQSLKQLVNVETTCQGGQGAIREAIDLILANR
jgi:N-acylneuraminate cytidylyltransferase